jgi:hypothetical protein
MFIRSAPDLHSKKYRFEMASIVGAAFGGAIAPRAEFRTPPRNEL